MSTEATKEKIIEAAFDEFANVGYHNATVRNISRRAGVNLAAINYHFSSKYELYQHVFHNACQKAPDFNELPSGKGINSQEQLETMLFEWIKVFTTRIFGFEAEEDTRKYRLMMYEMINPSEIYDELLEQYMRRDVDPLIKIISAGMPGRSKEDVFVKVFAILGRCLYYIFHRRAVRNFTGIEGFGIKNIDKIIVENFKESVHSLKYEDHK